MSYKIQYRSYDKKPQRGVLRLLDQIVEPDFNCIDVGANIGCITMHMRRLASRGIVVSIEPDTKNYDILLHHLKINNERAITLNIGLSDAPGELPLYINPRNHGDYRLWEEYGTKKLRQRYKYKGQVRVDTLDHVLSELPRVKFDLIKIDTQGMEYHILLGARLFLESFNGYMIIELWPPGLRGMKVNRSHFIELLFDNFDSIYEMDRKRRMTPRKLEEIGNSLGSNDINLLCIKNKPNFSWE